jgi:molecular chaperone GrpE (heat shock protein)
MDNPEPLGFQVIDKRQFADLEKIDMEAPVEEKRRYPSFVEELMARMAEMERKFEEKKKQIDEEISRAKNRLAAEYDRELELEKQKIILSFLEVLDNLQRAIEASSQAGAAEHLLAGVQMTAELFRSKLQSIGVEPMAALDQAFDPNWQQAVGMVGVAEPGLEGMVVEEVQAGYRMNGQLLRPARVRVGHLE